MDLRTKRAICLLIGIASILTIVGTISYAYFTAIADMNQVEADLSSARVSVIFDDNDEGIDGELVFGESITKKFTIENTGTVNAQVKMYWVNLINTYLEDSLTYTLSYSENEEGPYTNIIGNRKVPQASIASKQELADYLTIPYEKTYYYNLEITLNNLPDVDQTPDLSAIFNSKFRVEDTHYKTPIKRIIASSQGIRTNFDEPALTDEGVFEMEDDYGTSYYLRGAVENNYVEFAGFYWRIIRVNGDGSLRIIYDGTEAHTNGEESDDRFTHLNQKFNTLYDDAKYVGWMYGPANTVAGTTTPSTSKEQAQTNTADSDIKKVVDAWYKENIEDKGYGQYVSDTLFCNDRSIPGKNITNFKADTGLGYGAKITAYGPYGRFLTGNNGNVAYPRTNIKPIFKCPQQNDAFTVSDVSKGNGALEYPIGLITIDEIVTAGSGKGGTENNQFYLYKGSLYWSLSPVHLPGALTATLYGFDITHHGTASNDNTYSITPVINLTSEYVSNMIGNGTMENPYRTE